MKVAVAVPTTGRAGIVKETLRRLERQTRAPDLLVIVGADPADVAGLSDIPGVEIGFAERGLCRQRNRAIELVGDRADVVVFFDDDFVAAETYLERVDQLFSQNPDIAAATGFIVADGISSSGISLEAADALIAQYEQSGAAGDHIEDRGGLYGCNMSIRLSAAQGVVFDVNLPLYGWQEDIDFTRQLMSRGRVVYTDAFAGVHLGVKSGRTSGKRLGYSQIANPAYLLRKGSMPASMAFRLASRNVAANLIKSLRPEPYVDRRGRLLGNLIGLQDLLLGKADPTRILRL